MTESKSQMQEAFELRAKVMPLLDCRDFNKVLEELEFQTSELVEKRKDNLFLLAEIAGSYITLGDESYNVDAVKFGMKLFTDNREILLDYITEESIDYCLGNGYHALYKISSTGNVEHFPRPETVKDFLFEAKQAYFRAFKKINLKALNSFSIQVLTNLGNNLNHSGRIVEALQLFDLVLEYNPRFPQAVTSKADGLFYMIRVTNCALTTSLFAEMFRLYKTAAEQPIALENIKIGVENGLRITTKFLQDTDFDLEKLPKELILNEIEYQNHPKEIRYYLDNFLSLSEHGLYCKCNGARIDNLIIGHQGLLITNKKLLYLEFLLNRIKSEFSLARSSFYDYLHNRKRDIIYYEEVIPGVVNGLRSEKLRNSFRICFGILDKIAEGICYLLDLNKKRGENIYFESFWNNPKTPERWSKINSINNIHLTALYSIACDLNKNGEFAFYKAWRNLLEHGVFTITKKGKMDVSLLTEKFSEYENEIDFANKSKHLLQLTRSAIFSYVFLVRRELVDRSQ